MKKKYFGRIVCGMLAVCFVFSLILTLIYYFSVTERIDTDFKAEKERQSLKIVADMQLYFENSKTAAKEMALLWDTFERRRLKEEALFETMEKFCDIGHTYIICEDREVVKKDNAPLLSDNLCDVIKSKDKENYVFDFVDGETRIIALATKAYSPSEKGVFVVRALEEEKLLAGRADALMYFDSSSEVYAGNGEYYNSLKNVVYETGKSSLEEKIKNNAFDTADCTYIFTSDDAFGKGAFIFMYNNETTQAAKASVMLICIAVFFIVLIALFLISLIPAKIIYGPFDELMAFVGRYGDEKKDKYDEISYITSTVKFLDDKNNTLNSEAREKKELLKLQFVKDLLSGVVNETEYNDLAEEFSMTNFETPFYVGIFEISDYDSLSDVFDEKNLIQIKKQIGEFITRELTGRSVCGAVEIDKKRFAVITCGCELNKIRQNFSYINSVINSEFDIEMLALLGNKCGGLFEVGESYQQCTKAFEESLAIGGFRSGVVSIGDMDIGQGFFYPVNLERDLISSVIRLKREESLKIINSILDENLNGKTLTKERHNAITFAFIATINRIVEALNKTIAEIYGEDNIIFLELKMCENATELRNKVVQSFDRIMNYMSGDEDADLSQRFLDYIHSHYNEDISLTELGAHFKLSECYISTVFKESTGENFKDYLSRYRIKKAKDILYKNPDIKTKELASMIGCNTVATLFRLFNKYEGMSPGQFVKNNVK